MQVPGQAPPSPKAAKRYEIDAKRIGVNLNGEDLLPRSREFLRIDSSYYVGWMFEGLYKYNHAADYLGFRNASIPLERAIRLLERDFGKEIRLRTSELIEFYPTFKYKIDYTYIAFNLMNCYANMEEPDKAFALLQKAKNYNLQRDLYLDVYNYLGWTVHRSRFYTSGRYPFLKNSIDDNERLANSYLDAGLRKIARDRVVNSKIFPPGYEQADKLAVYHYKAILQSYALNVDSAAYYFKLMRNTSIFPHNNYATFRAICGDFRVAEDEYRQAAAQESEDKRLKEYIYYSSILQIYKHQPREAAAYLKEVIRGNGSTPGFGWYNIALARSLYYYGQMSESQRYCDKAAQFKELHIGTTLGQSHYDFSIQLNRLMTKEAMLEQQKFEHANWWYNPSTLAAMAKQQGDRYLQQFLIINQLAQNPERDRVIYKLFSTESTVAWDEVWYLIKDYSTNFFVKRFQKELQEDKRPNIRRYYAYFLVRLMMEQGKYKEALPELERLIRLRETDQEYERLYMGRLFESAARCAAELKNDNAYANYVYLCYREYPQLLPFTGLQMPMHLNLHGTPEQAVVARLQQCNIRWRPAGTLVPTAHLQFYRKGSDKYALYWVTDANGRELVPQQSMRWAKAEEAGPALAYRFFGIGDPIPDEDQAKK